MSLSKLIQKRDSGHVATATVATFATDEGENGRTVATVASVAVANSQKTKHWQWRVSFSDRPAKLVFCSPESSRDEVMADYPAAIRAEPLTPPMRSPGVPMTDDEEAEILRWLDRIGEDDQETIAEVLTACWQDAEARGYYARRAKV
jgi:hypothetical protein